MKKMFIYLTALVIALAVTAGDVQAKEGTVELSGTSVSCEGVSLWKERNYRVMGRCDGLVYPFDTQLEHYVLWAKTDVRGELVRVGEITRGYFDGNVADSFSSLYVTAEGDGLPRRPSSSQVATGVVSKFAFARDGAVVEPVSTPAPIADNAGESMTVQNGATSQASSGNAVGEVIGKILRSLLRESMRSS